MINSLHESKMKLLCIIVVINLVIGTVCSCPKDVCMCKWKGGKQNVECSGKSLADIPDGMDPGTQVLNFTGNNLQYLANERFLQMDLTNLQKIFLSRNQVTRIHEKAFSGLSNLVELDLAENMLTTVPTDTFRDYASLMRLTLSGNPIRELRPNAFRHLSFLTTLEMSNCQLNNVSSEAFIGLDNLEWLKLDGNRITTILGNHILPQSLHGINMQGNPWNCNCQMMDLHAWLVKFNVPQQGDGPTCATPPRLAGEAVKQLQSDDLACLPEITPTTLYLEISEGRNISLLCKITASPEASVSWWFQGQILQNDSLLAPNLHLYYYIEEGLEEKRSELFIYNTNPEDNGTFSCIAENPAGRIQANYTIRVIVKEEPVVEEITFSYEHFIIIIVGAGVAAFLLVLCCCCIILRCRRKTRQTRKRQESVKDTNMQLQSNQIKCSSIMNNSHEPVPILKNGNLNSQPQDLMLYVTQSVQNQNNDVPAVSSSQYCSPPSMRNYQEQNPDLINDAESVKGRLKAETDDTGSDHGSVGPISLQGSCDNGYHPNAKLLRATPQRYNPMATLPRNLNKDLYQHQVDVHLNPGCFLGQDGYPVEYRLQGVPVMPHLIPTQTNNQVNYYRTLPHKPKTSSANHGVRFSMEAEFLGRSTASPFDTYNFAKDIRYTAEGYPRQPKQVAFADQQQFPSPPEGYKGDIGMLGSPVAVTGANGTTVLCTAVVAPPALQQWPPCLPGYHSQIVPIKTQSMEPKRYPSPSLLSPNSTQMNKRCVGAQTSTIDKDTIPEQQEEEAEEGSASGDDVKLRHLTGPLADSPDEGYVGDGQDTTDI